MNNYQLLILAVFIGLISGYILSIFINRHRDGRGRTSALPPKDRIRSNTAFMKGIHYILSEKTDQAIEELTRAVSVDTEAVETYVALANLYRSKGEIDRAVRIRQSIILRPNLDSGIRVRALTDLGVDYHRGGFFDRAVKTFEEVIRIDPDHPEAHRNLVRIYEETKDWERAYEVGERLARLIPDQIHPALAHYQVEIGKILCDRGAGAQAMTAYKKALSLFPGCIDAYLHMGDLHLRENRPELAVETWRRIADVAPGMVFLVFGRLARVAVEMKDLQPVEDFLRRCADDDRNPLARLALARLFLQRENYDEAVTELTQALRLDPNLFEARRELGLILLSQGRTQDAQEAYRDLLTSMTAPEATFQCGHCGFESRELMWRCPQCVQWDTMTLHRHIPLLFDQPADSSAERSRPVGKNPVSERVLL